MYLLGVYYHTSSFQSHPPKILNWKGDRVVACLKGQWIPYNLSSAFFLNVKEYEYLFREQKPIANNHKNHF